MISSELNALIDRPIKGVFTFVSDLNNAPKWQSQLVGIHRSPNGVGTTYKTAAELMGRRMQGRAEITAYQPVSTFGFNTDACPVQGKATVSLKSGGTGARLSLRGEGDPGEVLKLAEGALAKQVNSQMEANLARLKTFPEGA